MAYQYLRYITIILLLSTPKIYANNLTVKAGDYSYKCLSELKLPITLNFSCLESTDQCFLHKDSLLDISNLDIKYERHDIFNRLDECKIIKDMANKLSFYSLGKNGWKNKLKA
jgi:hypothetical protein